MTVRQQKRRDARRRASARAGLVSGGVVALTLIPTSGAQAATFKVTNEHDSGPGSLRQAVIDANAASGTPSDPAMITFASSVTGSINLESVLPPITDSIDIVGPGARKVTLNAASITASQSVVRVLPTESSTVTISGLSMDNADVGVRNGGFVYTYLGSTVTFRDDTFKNDTARYHGGAIYTVGAATIEDSTFSDDSAGLGGAFATGYISDSTVEDSTFVNDHATMFGGAIFVSPGGELEVKDSTITGNSVTVPSKSVGDYAYGYGGGVAAIESRLTLLDTIVADNTATGNPAYRGTRAPVRGSLHRDVYLAYGEGRAYFVSGFDLIQHDTKYLGLSSSDITGRSPDLGPLLNNGGETDTELPNPGSAAVNAGKAFGLPTDQRGDKRTIRYPGVKKATGGDYTDIGATELQPGPPNLALTKTASAKVVKAGHNVDYTLALENRGSSTAHDVKLCDMLPSTLAYVSSSPGAKLNGEDYCWKVGNLAAHHSRRFTLVANVMLRTGGTIINHANATAPGLRTVYSSATITTPAAPITPCSVRTGSARRKPAC